jgi:hypothetical protein
VLNNLAPFHSLWEKEKEREKQSKEKDKVMKEEEEEKEEEEKLQCPGVLQTNYFILFHVKNNSLHIILLPLVIAKFPVY